MTDQEVVDALRRAAELARRLHRVDVAFHEAHPDGVVDGTDFPADQQPVEVSQNPTRTELLAYRDVTMVRWEPGAGRAGVLGSSVHAPSDRHGFVSQEVRDLADS